MVRIKGFLGKLSWVKNLLILGGLLTLVGCTCFSIPLMQREGKLEETVVSGKGRDKILLLDISGVISSKERRKGLFQERTSMVAQLREELKKASQDERVKVVILRLNTP